MSEVRRLTPLARVALGAAGPGLFVLGTAILDRQEADNFSPSYGPAGTWVIVMLLGWVWTAAYLGFCAVGAARRVWTAVASGALLLWLAWGVLLLYAAGAGMGG